MTNTKKMTGALAFLSLIAVLDNFIFVEPDPDFEEMVLIAADASQTESGDDVNILDPFWIDTHEVSHANFAQFVTSTGYQPKTAMWKNEWPKQDTSADATPAEPHPQTAGLSDSFAQVNHEDALAYCNWLGKDLPSDLQVKVAAAAGVKGDGISEKLQSLPHDRTLSKTWTGRDHDRGLVIAAGNGTGDRKLAPAGTDNTEYSGFVCVKNVDSVQD